MPTSIENIRYVLDGYWVKSPLKTKSPWNISKGFLILVNSKNYSITALKVTVADEPAVKGELSTNLTCVMLGLTPEPVLQVLAKEAPLSLEQVIVEATFEVTELIKKSVLAVGILSIISTTFEGPLPMF